jgi:hypothetical protein
MNTKSNILTILEEAIDLFKSNYKLFLTISFLSAVCGLLFSVGSQMINADDFINATVLVLIGIITFYFSFRLQIALIIAINNRYHGFETDFQECYKTAWSYFWSFVTTSIALALILGLSIVFILLPVSMEASLLVIFSCGLIFGGLALVLLYLFNFAPLVSVLNPEVANNFNKSRELVRSQPRLVLSMLGLGLIAQLLLYFIKDMFGGYSFTLNMEISFIFDFLIGVFISPIFMIVYMMVYYKLQSTSHDQEGAADTATE